MSFSLICIFFLFLSTDKISRISSQFKWNVFSWLYGLLVFTWMLTNIDDSTRVFFTVNLRENFALPFFWLQNACVVVVLRFSNVACKKYYFIFFFSTFMFALFWQFNQVLLWISYISFAFFFCSSTILISVQCTSQMQDKWEMKRIVVFSIFCHMVRPILIARKILIIGIEIEKVVLRPLYGKDDTIMEIPKRWYLFRINNIVTVAVHLGAAVDISCWNEFDYTSSIIYHCFISRAAVTGIFLGSISAVWPANEYCFYLHGL